MGQPLNGLAVVRVGTLPVMLFFRIEGVLGGLFFGKHQNDESHFHILIVDKI